MEFETCVIALKGAEGLRTRNFGWNVEGVEKLAVYGCLKWGYHAGLQPDGTYVITRQLMGQTTSDDDIGLAATGGGGAPGQVFRDVINDYFTYSVSPW